MQNTNELLKTLPETIQNMIAHYGKKTVSIGRSGNCVFRIHNGTYLKISEDITTLEKEKERDLWLENRLLAPKVLSFGKCLKTKQNDPDAAFLLTSAVQGDMLCDEKFLSNPDRLTSLLAEAMTIFHALPENECPFFAEQNKSRTDRKLTVCHGDFCLPNILFNGKSFGFIDLGDMGKGDKWLDYAWCLWSLDYNLKTEKYREMMLKKLGIDFDKEKYQSYVPY